MARGDKVDVESREGLEGGLSLSAVEHENVGVVFLTFKEQN